MGWGDAVQLLVVLLVETFFDSRMDFVLLLCMDLAR